MTVTYSTDSKIKSIFGNANWNQWADLDNDQNAGKMTAASDGARVRAYREINSRLRPTHYRLPVTDAAGGVPAEIEALEATMAGVFLQAPRGEEDGGPRMKYWQETIDKTFADILSGAMRLDAL